MAKKPKVEVDEELVRKMIGGQIPLTTNVTHEISDPERPEQQGEPEPDRKTGEKQESDTPLRRSLDGGGLWSSPISNRPT